MMSKIKATLLATVLVITTASVGYLLFAYFTKNENLPVLIEKYQKDSVVDQNIVTSRNNCRKDAQTWANEMTVIINRSDGDDFRNEKTLIESFYNEKYQTCLFHYEHKKSIGNVGIDEEIINSGYGIYDLTNEKAVIYIETGEDGRDFEIMKNKLFK